jgi:two-component system response regulator RegX3
MTTTIQLSHNEQVLAQDSIRVLLVDDDARVRLSVADALESDGFEVESASSGRDAIDKYRSDDWDIVLMDLGLPDTDGWEAAERISFIDPTVPIVVFTGQPAQSAKAREIGAAALVEKPVNFPKLMNLLRHLARGKARWHDHADEELTMDPQFTFVGRR